MTPDLRDIEAMRRGRAIFRRHRISRLAPGQRHVDRIIRDSADRRLGADVTTVRLIAACDLAEVLDGAA